MCIRIHKGSTCVFFKNKSISFTDPRIFRLRRYVSLTLKATQMRYIPNPMCHNEMACRASSLRNSLMLMIYNNQLRKWKVIFSAKGILFHLNIHVTQQEIHFTVVCHNFLSNFVLQIWYMRARIQLNKTVALKLNS